MTWLIIVEWLARLILIFLFVLSIWSLSIIIERRKFFKSLKFDNQKLKSLIQLQNKNELKKIADTSSDLSAQLLKAILAVSGSAQKEKAFDAFINEERLKMEKGLAILGTLGSTTPFVGLLGTILGIIVSFGQLAKGGGDTNMVMYSLAEALILTAVGLFVAIPAVVAFNFFSKKLKTILTEAQSLKDYYLAHLGE